ncbi:UNVERIFIED_CONTAM: Delta(8)-fatty-acid desaturase [Sesamum calycinum]|uniref:Delta(8)-fatty-acid desaturase n=1 Tax=Sesamum calycinum TaxID=2727403 RepID=A0AAW2NVY7_9LAMI
MAENVKKYITSDELKKHNKPDDLWLSVQGKVYNVTEWAKIHPGGATPLLHLAGQDVTDAFIAFHPGSAWKHLDKFFTGYHLEDFQVSDVSKDYRKLVTQFAKSGMFEKKGHGVIYSLCFIALLFYACLYGVLYCNSFWIHMLSAAILGIAWMQVTYLGHDSGHYEIMMNRGFNKLAQIVTGNCLTGISIAWWKWTHNAHHETHIRFHGKVSCELSAFDILSSDVRCQSQSVCADIIASVLTKEKVPDRALNIFGILVFWTWFPLLLSRLPNWNERILFVLASFCVTSIQHIQFCLNHFAANVYVGAPKGNDWFEKQTSGTIDISCSPRMDWFFGGLQFQLEHHLFPRLPRCHFRNISPLVQDLCKKHNLPYRSLSFLDANKLTYRTLRTAAMEARDFSSPVPKNLLWEAVNTHG